MDKKFPILNLFLGTVLGAAVSLSGVYFKIIDLQNDDRRFTLEFFQKWDSIMNEAKTPEQRLAGLRRLELAHTEPPLTVIARSIKLANIEIEEAEELRRKTQLRREAERAKARAAREREAAAKARAEKQARDAAEKAKKATEQAAKLTQQILKLNRDLGYAVDKDGRRLSPR